MGIKDILNKNKTPKGGTEHTHWKDSDNTEARMQWANVEIEQTLKKFNCTLVINHKIDIVALPKAEDITGIQSIEPIETAKA